jgi:hypothetical protein
VRSRFTCSGVAGISESASVKLHGEHERFEDGEGSKGTLMLKSSSILLQLLVKLHRPLVYT